MDANKGGWTSRHFMHISKHRSRNIGELQDAGTNGCRFGGQLGVSGGSPGSIAGNSPLIRETFLPRHRDSSRTNTEHLHIEEQSGLPLYTRSPYHRCALRRREISHGIRRKGILLYYFSHVCNNAALVPGLLLKTCLYYAPSFMPFHTNRDVKRLLLLLYPRYTTISAWTSGEDS